MLGLQFHHFITVNKTLEVRPHLLWETAKAFMRGTIISYIAYQRKIQTNKCLELENQLSDLQRKYNANPFMKIYTNLRLLMSPNKIC